MEMKFTTNSIKAFIWDIFHQPSKHNEKAIEELDQVVRKKQTYTGIGHSKPSLPSSNSQGIIKAAPRSNTTIFINVWEVGRDLTQWENPLEFMPGRFENQQLDVRGQHFHLVPFGAGEGNLDSVDMVEVNGVTLPRANPLVCVPVARLHPIPLSA
nr:hypothetical protein [Tanacetum cinerariifolium]